MEETLDINGHPTWVRDDGGDGPRLLLLHGGFVGSETNFGALFPELGSDHRLVMFDRRGHGRTADGPGPFSYSAMADETIAVIEHFGLPPVRAVGYSDGGALLFDLALRRPDLLESMVLIGANFHHDGLLPVAADWLRDAGQDELLSGLYAAQSPDGADHWPMVVEKGLTMAMLQPTWTPDDLRAITTPTLVLVGDDDLFPLSHTSALFEALPDAQLAIVPGTSHLSGIEKPNLVARLITEFVTNPKAERMMPMQRRAR